MTAKKSVELQTLDLLVELLPSMKELHVYGISPRHDKLEPSFEYGWAARMAKAAGVAVIVEAHPSSTGTYYTADFVYSGQSFGGCIDEKDLPSIGYHLVDGKPVPLNKSEATA